MRTLLSRAVFVVALLLPWPLFSAGFECSKASTTVERLVCSNKAISSQDSELTFLYRTLMKLSGNDESIRKSQREWLLNTRNKCGDVSCLADKYTDQLNSLFTILMSLIGSDSNGSNRTPVGPHQYLVLDAQSLYYVNLSESVTTRLTGGTNVEQKAFGHVKDGSPWYLFETSGLSRGEHWQRYEVVIVWRNSSRERSYDVQQLLFVSQDGEGGMCGQDPPRAKSIGLAKATKILALNAPVIEGGNPAIVFDLHEKDCETWKERRISKRFVYQNGKFHLAK